MDKRPVAVGRERGETEMGDPAGADRRRNARVSPRVRSRPTLLETLGARALVFSTALNLLGCATDTCRDAETFVRAVSPYPDRVVALFGPFPTSEGSEPLPPHLDVYLRAFPPGPTFADSMSFFFFKATHRGSPPAFGDPPAVLELSFGGITVQVDPCAEDRSRSGSCFLDRVFYELPTVLVRRMAEAKKVTGRIGNLREFRLGEAEFTRLGLDPKRTVR